MLALPVLVMLGLWSPRGRCCCSSRRHPPSHCHTTPRVTRGCDTVRLQSRSCAPNGPRARGDGSPWWPGRGGYGSHPHYPSCGGLSPRRIGEGQPRKPGPPGSVIRERYVQTSPSPDRGAVPARQLSCWWAGESVLRCSSRIRWWILPWTDRSLALTDVVPNESGATTKEEVEHGTSVSVCLPLRCRPEFAGKYRGAPSSAGNSSPATPCRGPEKCRPRSLGPPLGRGA